MQNIIDRIYYDPVTGQILSRTFIQGNLTISDNDNWIDGSNIADIKYKRVDINTKTLSNIDGYELKILDEKKSRERQRRNSLLIDSDWTELPSNQNNNTVEWRNAWATYRQQLRDLDFTEPDHIVWPQKPTV